MARQPIENKVRVFNSGAELPSLDELLGPEHPDEDVAEEIAAVAGEEGRPQASVAAMMVLDAIRSPFVTVTTDKPSLRDVVIAMYVLSHPREAAGLIPGHVASVRAESAFAKTAKTPEHLAVFLDKLVQDDALERTATLWVDGLPDFSPAQAVDDIGKMLTVAMSGWRMIPKDDDTQKKMKGSTSPG